MRRSRVDISAINSLLDFQFDVGTMLDREGRKTKDILRLHDEQVSTHIALVGPTGSGKSRVLWNLMRSYRRVGRGFCVVDTGDLVKDFLADCAAEVFMKRNLHLLAKLHYVKLGPGPMPRYDPFSFTLPEDIPEELRKGAYVCWRNRRVHSEQRVFQAQTTGSVDFQGQARRHRVMRNMLMAIATHVDAQRLTLEDVFIFLDPSHKYHKKAVDRVAPFIPREIRRDIERLGGFKSLRDLLQETESTINSLGMVLGECMKNFLSGPSNLPCMSMQEIVDQGGYLLVDCQSDDFVGEDENIALASQMSMDYIEEHMRRPKHKRKQSGFITDETPELLAPLGRQLGRWLRIVRKYGVGMCMSFQDLESMKREEFTLAPTVLGQCGTIMCFHARWHEDMAILAKLMLTGNLVFKELMQEVERSGGHQFLQIDEYSESVSHQIGNAKMSDRSVMDTQTKTDTKQDHHGRGKTKNVVLDRLGNRISTGEAENGVNGGGLMHGTGNAHGEGRREGTTQSETDGWSMTINHKIVPLPIVLRELQRTGQLETALGDQQGRDEQILHGLEKRQVLVLAPGMKQAVMVETTEILDPFLSPDDQDKAIQLLKQELVETHDYYFQSTFDYCEQDERARLFLGENQTTVVDDSTEKGSEDQLSQPPSRNGNRVGNGQSPSVNGHVPGAAKSPLD